MKERAEVNEGFFGEKSYVKVHLNKQIDYENYDVNFRYVQVNLKKRNPFLVRFLVRS